MEYTVNISNKDFKDYIIRYVEELYKIQINYQDITIKVNTDESNNFISSTISININKE